jgi:hypothetical protein
MLHGLRHCRKTCGKTFFSITHQKVQFNSFFITHGLLILSSQLPRFHYLDKIMLAIINTIMHPLINFKRDSPRILMTYSVFYMHYRFVIIDMSGS